jgi:2-methylcitrate dehydratase PrpD
MKLARHLAERVTAMRYEDLPPEAVYWSRIAVLDTVGVALAGSVEAPPRLVEDVLELQPGSGPSLILGGSRRVGPLDAALVNGAAAHVLDYDNTASHMGGHVSAVMVPALIAAGEAFGASGRDVLLAHAAGFEASARIGRGVNDYHTDKGWHPTTTLGVFAVAAACARLLNLSVEQTETALALSTSLAAGLKANFGTMTKSLHVGQCARGGLMAALLARKGYTANPDAFEHKQGFFKVFNGDGNYDVAAIIESWGTPLEIVVPGASYKQYPCCYSTHSAIEAALDIVRQHGGPLDPAAIARVDSWTHATRLLHTDRPEPNSALEAKFSVQYCVARALVNGKVVLEHFEESAYGEPALRGLLTRVHAAPYTGKLYDAADPFDAEVKVTLADGGSFTAHVDRPLGRTSEVPIPAANLRAKFEDCAARALAPKAVAAVTRAIEAFEDVKSVREFTKLLEPGAAGGTAARRDAARSLAR